MFNPGPIRLIGLEFNSVPVRLVGFELNGQPRTNQLCLVEMGRDRTKEEQAAFSQAIGCCSAKKVVVVRPFQRQPLDQLVDLQSLLA